MFLFGVFLYVLLVLLFPDGTFDPFLWYFCFFFGTFVSFSLVLLFPDGMFVSFSPKKSKMEGNTRKRLEAGAEGGGGQNVDFELNRESLAAPVAEIRGF